MTVLGSNTFGMELHPVDPAAFMLEPHDQAVLGLGGDGETGGQAMPLHDQRMIARRLERVGDVVEYPLAAMVNARQLAVHQDGRADHLAAIGLADRLMAKANPEDRQVFRRSRDEIETDAGL